MHGEQLRCWWQRAPQRGEGQIPQTLGELVPPWAVPVGRLRDRDVVTCVRNSYGRTPIKRDLGPKKLWVNIWTTETVLGAQKRHWVPTREG